jgi:tripartite-type tricarboxylate transporter receptor subunit TctC
MTSLPVSITAGALLAAAAAGSVFGQDFPTRQITIICSNPPGGITDWQARAFGDLLSKRLGQPVVVENRPGGGGVVALAAIKLAKPDGHTLMTVTTASGAVPIFVKDASFEPGKDLAPVQISFWAPYVIITNTKVPAKTLREFLDYAKANPGKLNWSAVPNTTQHLDTLDLIRRTGVNIAVITYQGGAPALRALVANETQAYFGAVFGLEERVKSGQVTALAVTSAQPFPALPDLPTVKSAIGLDADLRVRYGFATTAGTPKPIVDRLARELGELSMRSELTAQIRKQGYEPESVTPEEFVTEMREQARRAREVAQTAGIKPQ